MSFYFKSTKINQLYMQRLFLWWFRYLKSFVRVENVWKNRMHVFYPEMPRQPVQTRGPKKQIFIEEKELAKLHIAVIYQPRCSRPVWIISRLSARPGLCFLCSGSWLASNQSTALFLLALFTFLSRRLRLRISCASLWNKDNMLSSLFAK